MLFVLVLGMKTFILTLFIQATRGTRETAQLFLEIIQTVKLRWNDATDSAKYSSGLEGKMQVNFRANSTEKLHRNFDDLGGHVISRRIKRIERIRSDHLGENFMEFWLRVEQGFSKVISIVTKIKILLSWAMELQFEMLHELIPWLPTVRTNRNASLNIVSIQMVKFHLKALNQTNFVLQEAKKNHMRCFLQKCTINKGLQYSELCYN